MILNLTRKIQSYKPLTPAMQNPSGISHNPNVMGKFKGHRHNDI